MNLSLTTPIAGVNSCDVTATAYITVTKSIRHPLDTVLVLNNGRQIRNVPCLVTLESFQVSSIILHPRITNHNSA